MQNHLSSDGQISYIDQFDSSPVMSAVPLPLSFSSICCSRMMEIQSLKRISIRILFGPSTHCAQTWSTGNGKFNSKSTEHARMRQTRPNSRTPRITKKFRSWQHIQYNINITTINLPIVMHGNDFSFTVQEKQWWHFQGLVSYVSQTEQHKYNVICFSDYRWGLDW